MPAASDHRLSWLLKANDDAITQWATAAASTRDEAALRTLLEFYLIQAGRKQGQLSARTLATYHTALTAFLTWCAAEHVSLTTPARRDLARYRTHLDQRANRGRRGGRTLSPSTISVYLTTARLLYRALHWAGVIREALPDDVRSPHDPTRSVIRNPPYEEELELALQSASPALQALLLLCSHGGLRITEALSARKSHLHAGVLTVHGKGGKARHVPLSARTRAALLLLPSSPQHDRYFEWTYHQAYYRLQVLFRQLQLTWRGFHAARKSAATRLYHQTHDFTRVAIFLGHSSADTTRRYVKIDEDDVATEVEDW